MDAEIGIEEFIKCVEAKHGGWMLLKFNELRENIRGRPLVGCCAAV